MSPTKKRVLGLFTVVAMPLAFASAAFSDNNRETEPTLPSLEIEAPASSAEDPLKTFSETVQAAIKAATGITPPCTCEQDVG